MMSRDVMQRQMFAKGGAAGFPDLNNDGNITQADILMGRGVKFMQEGGDPMAADPAAAMGETMDPQVLQGLLEQAQSNLGDMDAAEDYASVINSMRGDDAPIEARYAELAEIVGPEDARQTPESVLTLAQPAIMMNAVDQGIGGLAAEEMTAPVDGAMAQGIMSTVAPPPQPAMMAAPPAAPGPMMPPAGMGGPPPVNFNQGGLVRRGDNQPVVMMQTGGDPIAAAGRLGELYEQKMPLYKSILGDQSELLEEQKNLTQAQMLFDVAGAALAYANPTQAEIQAGRKLSPAERLAAAMTETKLLPTISARAGEQLKAKQAVNAAEQQMKLSALGAAEAGLTAEAKAAADLEKTKLTGAQKIAELTLEDKLSSASAKALETQKQSGRVGLENVRQTNRETLESVVQTNRKAIEELRQSGTEANTILADRLDKENIVLRGNIELGKMGVANEYDLAKMDKSHEQATELNTTNNALKEKLSGLDREISEKRLALDTKKAEVAEAQGARKLELQEEANIMQADLNAFEMNYKTDKLALEEAAARLTRLGTSTEARITTLVSNPERLAKYAAGTLGPEDTLEMNQAIAYYNSPKQVWNEKEKRFVLSPGNPLSNELMASIQIRNNSGLTVPNIKLDTLETPTMDEESKTAVKSAITEGLPDGALEAAFGSLPLAKSVANDLVEAFSFGKVGAPYKVSKDAITAAETLNTRTVQVFQKSADLRESVTQLNLLKDRTPEAAAFFTGPNKAASKIKAVIGMIRDEKVLLEKYLESDQYPMGSKEYMDATTALDKLNQLEAGYGVFSKAYSTVADNKMKALQQIIKKK